MKRRSLFQQVGLGSASVGFASACSRSQTAFTPEAESGDGPQIEWRMATSWPEDSEIRFGTVKHICDRISQLTQGNFVITAFPAGGIAPPIEILDTVQQGTVECGHTIGHYSIAKSRAFAFPGGLPFGLTAQQHMAWLFGAGGLELMRDLYAGIGIINFPAGSTGRQMGGWFRNKVNTLSDLQGLKMRMPGLGGEVLRRVGVEIQTLPSREILLALERNEIDATEWVGPYEDEKLGLHQYVRHYYYPGWHEPGTTYEILVNRDVYDRLPKEYQQAIKTAAFEAQVLMPSKYDAENGAALQRLLSSGVELVVFSDEILQGVKQAANDLYAEYASQDAVFRQIYDHWNAFRQGIYRWNSVNERSFADLIFDS
ncbi:MAG: ABC transporter substrate-binding protein [Cyanobacteria bacterium P01_D01_bin.115]